MNKKLIALSLICTIVICNSITVWAADTWSGNGTTNSYTKEEGGADSSTNNSGTKTITGTFTKDKAATYSVDISWEPLKFEYKGTLSWDGTSYNGNGDVWIPYGNVSSMQTIKVDNKSDKKVFVDVSFVQKHTYIKDQCLTGVFTNQVPGMGSNIKNITPISRYTLYTPAEYNTEDKSTWETINFGIYGKPTNVMLPADNLENVDIGSVTVKISEVS